MTITQQERQRACVLLAEKMGYTVQQITDRWDLWKCFKPNGEPQSPCATSVSRGWLDVPDFFGSAEASHELVVWLAANGERWHQFTYEFFAIVEVKDGDYVRAAMAADPLVKAIAACNSLRIALAYEF